MYLIINSTDDTICSEWNYINDKIKHICWRTSKQIDEDNSYRNDTTRPLKFMTKSAAQDYIRTKFGNQDNLEIVTTNYIEYLIDFLKNKIIHIGKNNDEVAHYLQ